MKKTLRELLKQQETKEQEVRSLIGENKLDDAETRMGEVREIKREIQLISELDDEERAGLKGQQHQAQSPSPQERDHKELESEYRGIFMKGMRRRKLSSDERSVVDEYEKRAVMHSGGATGQDDGDSNLIIPSDIQTQINEVARAFNDLTQFVRVENTNQATGSRVLEKDGEMTPFPKIEEYGEFEEVDNPKFTQLKYAVVKRGGILPLTRELLADTDQNILQYVTNWLGKKATVTRNHLILIELNKLSKKQLTNFDDIKKVINVGLDPTISQNAIILTNQDGYNWMDEQKDGNGNYLLKEDITNPGGYLFKGKRIAVASNRFLKTTTTNKVPYIVGDLQQTIVMFSRLFYELASTTEGGNAWLRDTTDLRAVMRDDIKTWDSEAAIYGQLTLE